MCLNWFASCSYPSSEQRSTRYMDRSSGRERSSATPTPMSQPVLFLPSSRGYRCLPEGIPAGILHPWSSPGPPANSRDAVASRLTDFASNRPQTFLLLFLLLLPIQYLPSPLPWYSLYSLLFRDPLHAVFSLEIHRQRHRRCVECATRRNLTSRLSFSSL